MRYKKQKYIVRGIAARPSESTGKSTGCESHKATWNGDQNRKTERNKTDHIFTERSLLHFKMLQCDFQKVHVKWISICCAKLLVFYMLVPGGPLGEMKHLPGNFFSLSRAPGPNIFRTLWYLDWCVKIVWVFKSLRNTYSIMTIHVF